MGEELKAKVGDMVLSDGQWYEVIGIEVADKDGPTSEYFCMPKDGPEVYISTGDIEAVDRGPAYAPKPEVFRLEKYLIPPRAWPDLRGMPGECQRVIDGPPECLGIGYHPDYGWFILGSGQGPALCWSERNPKDTG